MDKVKAAASRTGWVTLREVAGLLGRSYWAASALAASGALGKPMTIGRTQFFPRDRAERAVKRRIADRQAKGKRAPIAP